MAACGNENEKLVKEIAYYSELINKYKTGSVNNTINFTSHPRIDRHKLKWTKAQSASSVSGSKHDADSPQASNIHTVKSVQNSNDKKLVKLPLNNTTTGHDQITKSSQHHPSVSGVSKSSDNGHSVQSGSHLNSSKYKVIRNSGHLNKQDELMKKALVPKAVDGKSLSVKINVDHRKFPPVFQNIVDVKATILTSRESAVKSNFKIDKRLVQPVVPVHSKLSQHTKTRPLNTYVAQQNPKRQSQKSCFKINRQSTAGKDRSGPSCSSGALFVNQIMGRSVSNASRNKFKFVKSKTKQQLRVPSQSSLKLDRRRRKSLNRPTFQRSRCSLVMINGRVLRSKSRNVTPGHSHSHSFKLGRTGIDTMKIDRRSPRRRTLSARNDSQLMAQSVLHRSRQMALRLSRKKDGGEKKFCTFYNRFGRCKRGDQCPYVHDKTKVAVCRRFLRGNCPVTDCPFSHHVARDKMPVCGYYLRGVCTRESCPYLHVNVNSQADVCDKFLEGHCPNGQKCEKKHTHICQTYLKTGKCDNASKCKLKHPRKKEHLKKKEKKSGLVKEEVLAPGQMPSFISLADSPAPSAGHSRDQTAKDAIKIMPFFGDV